MSAYPTMPCQECGRVAPCMNVTFVQNVGLVILRFSRTLSGHLCKPCINAAFFRMSAISFFFGWWGIISFFVTLFTLPLNVVSFLRSLSLPSPDAASMQVAGGVGPSTSSSGSGDLGFGPPAGAGAGSGFGPPDPGQGFGPPAGSGPGFGAPPGGAVHLPPTPSTPSKALPIASILVGLAGLTTAGLVALVGVGMMVAPNKPDDPQSGLFCLVSSALCCGMPGLLGAGYGAWRLLSKSG